MNARALPVADLKGLPVSPMREFLECLLDRRDLAESQAEAGPLPTITPRLSTVTRSAQSSASSSL